MELSEAEIVRYSRQILLREVGGVGQRRLLDAEVELRGEGAAMATAAAYLGASGVAVAQASAWSGAKAVGFPEPPFRAAGRSPFPASIVRTAAVDGAEGAGDEVVIGGTEEGAVIVSAPRGTCARCVAESVRGAHAVPERIADLVGTLAALLQQRHILGLAHEPAVVRISLSGAISVAPIARCGACQ